MIRYILVFGLTTYFATIILLIGHYVVMTETDRVYFSFFVCLGISVALFLAQVIK